MSKLKILREDANYSFRSYFELPNDTDEVLAEFGYAFARTRLQLPRTNRQLERLNELRQQIEETIPYVSLSSEAAKREILIAPVLSRVAVISKRILRIEYPLKVNNLLQGNLDYLIQSEHSLIVVEAKRDDLTRGFTQLAVEMIALSMLENAPDTIYGTVTMGDVWVFGTLETASRTVTRDISSYTLPDNLEEIVKIFVGILE
ncbi:hypothetical protein ACF3DV_14965 [Chlorogloeopsis fritschii PCC 9212]|uniref:Type I restriction enzyme R protein N-terminal domain-containing protein n=1 Tax=Chlorogloeopsis fritschii PCC 6912 TaxID=211165 RepID=A0A3S1FQ96_CHLFR|nr:hypothetical protein [Chlorogloeopsis fritschii]RUR83512.1 hypothetical protein PCC6912_23450 [Chlorogloeopsis fritschii PCC 6912]